jgi:hypothetical protein
MLPALLLVLLCQADPTDGERLRRFQAMAPKVQNQVLLAIATATEETQDARQQALAKVAVVKSGLPPASPPPMHDPKTYASGVAPERLRLLPGDPRWEAARTRYPELRVLHDLQAGVRYDPGEGRCVRTLRQPSPEQVLANDLAGYPRNADLALAAALQALDSDASRRAVPRYFEHCFANLQAECFVGITLYEVWCAGKEHDIPDVDAVAFAREVGNDHSYVSPIPRGARRTALYQRIAEEFAQFREYRSTREAAAAAFLCADPDMHPTYKPLVDRFHYLFARHEEDPARVAKVLDGFKTRTAFLAAIDAEMNRSSAEAFGQVRRRKAAWTESARRIRAAALTALAEAGR